MRDKVTRGMSHAIVAAATAPSFSLCQQLHMANGLGKPQLEGIKRMGKQKS